MGKPRKPVRRKTDERAASDRAGKIEDGSVKPPLQTSGDSAKRTDAVQAGARQTIFTIGHSTHPLDEFVAILKNYGVAQLVDVRTVPKSRHVPQFNSESMSVELPKRGIDYVHMKSLGGLRRAKKDSINTGWRNGSFRGYADYMASDEFQQGIDQLLELARKKPTAIMCAEAVPWRCHRSLIGDALLVRGVQVEDIMNATSSRPHTLTKFASIDGQHIAYPAESNLELFQK
ncbi:MAG: DUF488 domain-containing protein [Candidatus Acidiferrum sp.]